MTLALIALMAPLSLTGCGAYVKTPASLRDPAPVFLADQGIHSCLFFPRPDGSIDAFCFSQYNYAAKNHDGPLNAPAALLIPSAGTLGKRSFKPADFSPAAVQEAYLRGEAYHRIDHLHTLIVERDKRDRLHQDLETQWLAGAPSRIDNSKRRFSFVKSDQSYSLFNTCNTMTSKWLEAMGCEVSGLMVTGDFSISSPNPRLDLAQVPEPASAGAPVRRGSASQH